MKALFILALGYCLLGMEKAQSDDIEAYNTGGTASEVYLHVVLDLGDTSLDTSVCTYGSDCAPPFMTAEAHHHLGAMYQEGDTVTAPGVFKAVLAAVLENNLLDDLQISLLISNHAQNRTGAMGSAGGGAILQGYRRLREHRSAFLATLLATPVLNSNSAHAFQPKETFFEWLRYLQGREVALGENTTGNFGQSHPFPDRDGVIINNAHYIPPQFMQHGCPKFYSVLFSLGLSGEDEDLNSQISTELLLPRDASFEQMMSYLHHSSTDLVPQIDMDVALQKTWVVSSRERSGDAAEIALAGKSEEVMYVDQPQELQAQLTKALVTLVAFSSAGQSVSFSWDAFNPGRALDEVFLSQFSPRESSSWPGNVKKLKLKSSLVASDALAGSDNSLFDQIVDARGAPAFELVGDDKGQLRFDALTYWSDETAFSAGNGKTILDYADGRVVARGGAGQKIDGVTNYSTAQGGVVRYFIGDTNSDAAIDGYPPRQLYYESPSSQDFQPFNADAQTLLTLKPFLDPDDNLQNEAALSLIKWARGQDTLNGQSSARGWIMGEVLHSKPFALNYGATTGYSQDNPNIRLLFGSGEGVFHILENTNVDGDETGREVFGFYPAEMLSNIRSNQNNAFTNRPRQYGVDGAPVVLSVDRNGDGTIDHSVGDEAFVYFGLRRGGSSYFALDISDPDAVPRLLWKISPTVGGVFDELGLTFSTPLVGKVNYNGTPEDVLVFAAGYNGGWGTDNHSRLGKDAGADDDTVGNAIYIVNARTGVLIWKAVRGTTSSRSNTHYEHAALVDSIPSEVAALVTPSGIMHRLYVGDTGGALWRIDLPLSTGGNDNHRRDNWFITKLADLGFDSQEAGGEISADRRFFHAPAIVRSYDNEGDFDGVLIQSGNRAEPNETLVENYLFYIKDRDIESGTVAGHESDDTVSSSAQFHFLDLLDQTQCISVGEDRSDGGEMISCGERNLEIGWKVRYKKAGEKGLSTPLVDGGRVFASTFVPGYFDACNSRPGQGQMHVLNLSNATAVANNLREYEMGPGIPPAAESIGDILYLPAGGIDLYDLDGDGIRDTQKLLPSLAPKVYRTYWREPGADPL